MKKNHFILILSCLSFFSNAQVFWTENFGTGGAGWNLISVTGANGADPNFWKISDDEGGGISPNLGAPTSCGIASNGNNTMYITSVFNPSGGASYDAGGLCGFLFCPQTNVRTESPIINCVGKTNISINFNYIENGQNTLDDGTLWYFDGATWAQIDNMPKTLTGCGGQGLWTSRIVALPASANNNANVKIGFRWVNNDDGAGTDPSIAVDDITLSTPTTTTAPLSFTLTLPSPICQSNTLTTSFSFTPAATFTWSANSPNVVFSAVNSGTTNISFTAAGTYSVTLAACQGTVCGTSTASIQVIATPTINFVATPTVICLPGSSTLTLNGGPSSASYTWAASQGPAITNTSIAVVSPTATTTYTVLTSVPGCTTGIVFNVPVAPTPTVTVTANSSICNGQSIPLVAGGGATYTWSPAGTLSSPNGSNVTATPVTTTTYIVTGSNGVCTNTAAVTVTVGASTTVSVTPTSTVVCSGQSATLTASGGSTYTWAASTAPNPPNAAIVSVTPVTNTTYTVLTGTGACTAQAVATVNVAAAFGLTITPSNTVICSGGGGTGLSATSGLSYTWSPAAGLSSTSLANVTANPLTTTTYSLLATNGICTNSTTATVSVTVVNATVTASAPNYCLGATAVTLTGSGATSYSWAPATGLSSTNGAVVTATPATTTIYTLTATTGLCNSTKTISVTVPATTSLTIISTSTIICAGGTGATLTANGGNTYTWSPTAVNTASNAVTPATTTIYTVTGQTAAGCIAVPAVVTVSVIPSITPTLTASSLTVCLTKTITISASPTGAGISYTWAPASAIQGALNSSSIIAQPTTTATVIYTLTLSNGQCSKTETISISVFNCSPPDVSFTTLTNDSICTKGCVTFTSTTTGTQPLVYQWFVLGATPPTSNQANPEFCFNTAGNYTVVLIGTNAYGSDTLIKTNYINVADTPAVVRAYKDTLIKIGQLATIYATGATNYYWTPDNGTIACPTCSNTTVQPTVTTQYIVTGYTSKYCSRQDTIIITVDFTCGDFFVPNVFSPNNDGLNDMINVHGFCIGTYNLQIYSRWGEKVFETDIKTNSWDGTFRGRAMDTGVFVYKADGITIDGKPFSLKGNITLIR